MRFIWPVLPKGEWLRVILLITLCIFSVALYGSLGRAIWIDEFLHFAMGAYDGTTQAWDVIRSSIKGVNHGQTGIYMLVDYWLLKLFGASAVALRFPSLLSAGLMLYACATLLRLRGFGLFWQCFSIFVLCCQARLMFYAGEARPYMPLAAASVGALVFAVATPAQRRQWTVRILGGGLILLGVLIHPYFSIYWFLIFCFGLWFSCLNQERTFDYVGLKNYLNLPLCAVGSVVYFIIANLTWLVSHPQFDRDPFQQISREDLPRVFIWHHTEFFGFPERGAVLLAVIALFVVAYSFLPSAMRLRLRPVLAPAVLVLMALVISALLSLLSYFQNYWILTRQWIASIALVGLGCAWLCAELVRVIQQTLGQVSASVSPTAIKFVNVVFVGVILLYGIRLNQHNLLIRVESLSNHLSLIDVVRNIELEELNVCPMDNHAWAALANLNVQVGGAVWPIFRKYYEQALGGPDVCLNNIKDDTNIRIK